MTERSRKWRVVGAVYVLINLGGAGWAAANGEWLHAAGHVVLLLGGYLVWRLTTRARKQDPMPAQGGDEGLQYLQQSVDAIALEVERIGEAQRFNEKLRAERIETSPLQKDQ